MSFHWIYRSDPKTISGSSDEFATSDAAEEYMGDSYKQLLKDGHLTASLMDGDTELYTMKLTPA
jgi:hypothetical protein